MNRYWVSLFFFLIPTIALASRPSGQGILNQAKLASGGSAWNRIRTLHMEGKIVSGGQIGRFASFVELDKGKYRTNVSLGPVTQSIGFDGEMGWSRDSNGDVASHDSPPERKTDKTESYLSARGYWFPDRWPAKVQFLGANAQGTVRYDVLQITPKNAAPFRLWIDAATHRINRTILEDTLSHQVIEYSDYRRTHGVDLPFHIVISNGKGENKQVVSVLKASVNDVLGSNMFSAPKQDLADYSFARNKQVAKIPFRYIGDHIYLPVLINGHKFQFGLDSGGFNIVTPKTAKIIGMHAVGSLQATGVGSKSVRVKFARVPSITLDRQITIRNQLFAVVPLSGLNEVEGTHLDGVVGYEIFKRFVVRIDYAHRKLELMRPKDFDPRGAGAALAFTYDGRIPEVAGSLNGLKGRFDIDTGSRSSVTIYSPFVKRHHLLSLYRTTPKTVIGWGAGGAAYARVARGQSLKLGAAVVANPVVELATQTAGADAERYVAGIVGNKVLSHYILTFDYATQHMYLLSNQSHSKLIPFDRSGMWVNSRGHAFVVTFVMTGGPAQDAGLRIGDLIMSVDNEPATQLGLVKFRNLLMESVPGTKLQLRILRHHQNLTTTLVLRNLIPGSNESLGKRHAESGSAIHRSRKNIHKSAIAMNQ